uniref:RRM domain-containing protein n=1 Tax=Polytomella parva TaxID=51329 RepID=A0A7S0YJD3_9CHLO|mmetsp:Transcript_32271/g.58655  ORF Transcript_32271/g.58655 Transcript_32271/m.58655 type:complete len:128 (+) Transcript_32271:61-444(+)
MSADSDILTFNVPDTDTIYVSGLPKDVTEDEIAGYFGSIGILKIDKKTKRPKIWLYRDKSTGELKGDGTVTFEDPYTAGSAVEWFNNKTWKSSQLSVSLSERKQASGPPGRYGGGGGGGGSGGRGRR